MLVLLDSEPLGMVIHPKSSPENDECRDWLEKLLERGIGVIVPEIIDYELRREIIRIDSQNSIAKLDNLAANIGYLRLNSETFLIAASLWGRVRNAGGGTAPPERLDIDCILAAQAHQATARDKEIRIATGDINDLTQYETELVKALLWRDIK